MVLPNLLFVPFWFTGSPPRVFLILMFGLIGLFAQNLPKFAKFAIFLAAFSYSMAYFICTIFNLLISDAIVVISVIKKISPMRSPEYIVLAVVSIVTICLAYRSCERSTRLSSKTAYATAIAAVLAFAAVDYSVTWYSEGSYGNVASPDAPFDSATSNSGLLALADGKTDVMVVLVEAMGDPKNPVLSDRLESIWYNPKMRERYDMTSGTAPFHGSTTSGELRELCLGWKRYGDIATSQPNCLPNMLKEKGYTTASFHAFEHSFFDRSRWYPLIGFDHITFGESMAKAGATFCGGVWVGICDTEVPRFITAQRKKTKGPMFTYWLTLNSHLPVVEHTTPSTVKCKQLGAQMDKDFPMVCLLFAIWDDTARSLTDMATADDYPPTQILIVGDHMPPFFVGASRNLFEPDKVPWILLTPKRKVLSKDAH